MKSRWLRLLLLSLLPSLLLPLTHNAAAETSEERFVSGLLARRLFPLAELACQNRLSDAELSPREQAAWTVEMIRIMGQHAAHSLPAEQTARWQAAHQAAEAFLAEHPQHPRRLLIELQDALTYLAQGELARLEADIAVEPQEAFARAQDTIRTAARQLEAIDKQLTEKMATTNSSTEGTDELTVDELFSLQHNIHFQLARAFRNQGLCYPSDSNDRVAALSSAIKQLNATLTQLQANDSLAWQVYLDLATCYRLLGDFPQAQRALQTPLAESAPVAVRLQAHAEQAEILIADDRAQQALDELERARTTLKSSSPDLDFAQLEAMLAIWTTASAHKDEAAASQWQIKVAEMVAAIEQTHGAYWGRRAKLGQLAVAETGVVTGNVEILASSADEMYRKKQFDQALTTYEKAAELARAMGELPTAADIEFKAALIEQQLKRHEAAANRLQRLALEQTPNPESPNRHLLAAWNAAQVVRTDPTTVDRYQALLEEHLEQWPSDDTANTVRKWLGDLSRLQGNYESAVAAYRGITVDSKFYVEAIEQAAACWEAWLQRQQSADQETDTILADATEYFDGIILGSERRWPERWSEAQLAAALVTARLRLNFSSQGLVDAQRVLQAAMENAPADDKTWQGEAQSLLIVALAGQAGRQQEALQLLQTLGAESVDRLLQLVDGLTILAENGAPTVRTQIAEVQLAALNQLQTNTSQLDPKHQLRIDEVRAEALRISGQPLQALELYKRLAAGQPDNGSIQVKFAELLLQSDDQDTLSDAIVQWQKVARRVRPGTDAWLQARYSMALALYKRDRPPQADQSADRTVAAQRLRYLKATSDVDTSRWKAKVDQLLQRCEANNH